jgi:hypothetical protein
MAESLRRVSWRDLFPWLILLRTFRIAISPSVLALATAAVLISPLGWLIAASVFRPEFLERPLRRMPPAPWQLRAEQGSLVARWLPPAAREYLPAASTAVLEAYFDLAEPLARVFNRQTTIRETAYYALGFLWTLALWAFPGGFITRRAIVQLARDDPPGFVETAQLAGRRWLAYFLAPLYPLVPLIVIAFFIALLGVPIRLLPGAGSLLAGLVWIFVAIASLAALWLLGGLIFGFPLMWPTISAERDGDAFEAFSRSYSYVYAKPLHYFFYVVVAALFGALCYAVVLGAGAIVRDFGFWALAWGGTKPQVDEMYVLSMSFANGDSRPEHVSTAKLIGTALIGTIITLIHAALVAFRYTYFFAAAAAIYLLLRQDVDEKEMDEVFVPSSSPPTAPPLQPSSAADATLPAAAVEPFPSPSGRGPG